MRYDTSRVVANQSIVVSCGSNVARFLDVVCPPRRYQVLSHSRQIPHNPSQDRHDSLRTARARTERSFPKAPAPDLPHSGLLESGTSLSRRTGIVPTAEIPLYLSKSSLQHCSAFSIKRYIISHSLRRKAILTKPQHLSQRSINSTTSVFSCLCTWRFSAPAIRCYSTSAINSTRISSVAMNISLNWQRRCAR